MLASDLKLLKHGTDPLIIDHLFFNIFRYFSEFVLLGPELWLKSGFPYGFLHGFISEPVWCACCADHIFLNHNRTKIIGPCM